MSFAEKAIAFNAQLYFAGKLPAGIRIMNPFRENPPAVIASELFYRKYYNDNKPRHLIMGINPGRHGGGVTGVPFTDTVRLKDVCGINFAGPKTYEPSSVFIYDMIAAYGGATSFYSDFYINSICPLGFTQLKAGGKEINYNYYDSAELIKAIHPFIIESIQKYLELGVKRDICFLLGTGKNAAYFQTLNKKHGFFKQTIALEHPRYILQYKSKFRQDYIGKYLKAFSRI